ncbi:MAG: DUF3341 domain-containing protein [Hyphomicrobiaceae bacterium]|nr:DUF3341 domain-containing protein [Hyphomicrobiaceae bacterium]
MSRRDYGIMAEFETADRLIRATRAARQAGYRQMDAFAPFPMGEVSAVLGHKTKLVPVIAAVAALVGGGLTYLSQYWMNAIDYPLNVGGRPLNSWPAFIPATIIVSALWLAAAALLTMLIRCRLPRLNHPVFEVPGFERASVDRFFLCVLAGDPAYEPRDVAALLERHGAVAINRLELPA